MDFSISTSRLSKTFVFISSFVSCGVCSGKSNFKIYTRINQKKIKRSSKKNITRKRFKFWLIKNIFIKL